MNFFNKEDSLKFEILDLLKGISDLDRLVGKLAARKNFTERTRLSSSEFNQYSENQKLLSSHHDVLAWLEPLNNFGRTHFLSSKSFE